MTVEKPRAGIPPLVLVFTAVILGAIGQVLLKKGMTGLGASGLVALLSALLTPYVFLGLLVYALSTLIWLKVLSTQELSYVYPMIAAGYVIVTILSALLLHERISPMRGLSLAVICLGVAMLAIWGSNRKEAAAPTRPAGISRQGQITSATTPQTGSSELGG